ncbi:MAG: hypothetical protein BGO95_08865 [Micrococcales bacterium 73-13]|nr:MAG: hypothetical protein BGO95_08865 [Micrococcales bacterium 73-13]
MASGGSRPWPIAVDGRLRDELAGRLARPAAPAQLVVGDRGVGKSALLAAVAGRLEQRGLAMLRLAGDRELAGVPLGALMPLGRTAPISDPADVTDAPDDAGQRLAAALAALDGPAARRVLLVDDADELDPASAAVIATLLREGTCALLGATTAAAMPRPLLRLLAEDRIVEHRLAPLDRARAERVVRTALGAEATPELVERCLTRAAGNPLLLRAVVAEHERMSDPDAVPARIARLVEHELAALPAAPRRLAELLAIAGPLPVAALEPSTAVLRLERSGLARRDETLIALAHPLFADAIAAACSTRALRDRRREAAAALRAAGDDGRLRAARLLLDDPERAPDRDELLWAARHAAGRADPEGAARLADAAVAAGAGPEALLIRADARSVTGLLEEAEADFARAREAATGELLARVGSREGFHLAMRRQRHDLAVEVGERLLADLGPSAPRDALAADVGQWRQIALMQAGGRQFIPELDHAPAELELAVTAMAVAAYGGDIEGTRRTAARVAALAAASDAAGHAPELVQYAEFSALALEARLPEAGRLAATRAREAAPAYQGLWEFGRTLIAAHTGRPRDALRVAERAAGLLAGQDLTGTGGAADALRAAISAQLGDGAATEAILGATRSDPRTAPKVAVFAAEARAWRLAADGDRDAAAAAIADGIATGVEAGYRGYAILAAHQCVRIGRPGAVLHRLRELTRATPGPLLSLVLEHAEAAASADADRLLAVSARLAEAGLLPGAIDAARQAARLAAARSDRHAIATTADARIAEWASRGAESAVATLPPDGRALTATELRVARAAVRLGTSREVAEALGLSVRTVDNHLRQVYRKLGVGGRAHLPAALGLADRSGAPAPA